MAPRRRRSPWWALTGPAGLALLVALGPGAGARPDSPRRSDPGVPRGDPGYRAAAEIAHLPVRSLAAAGWESERLWSPFVDWEPAVAVDPSSAAVYQLTTRYHQPACAGCADPAIVFRRSRDGGATWGADQYLTFDPGEQADPQIAVAADGTLFAAFLQDWTPGAVLTRSRDGGATWSPPLAAIGDGPPSWSDKPLLAVSRDGRDVYLAFNAGASWVAASHDGGATFAPPVRTSFDGRTWFHSAGVVAADGSVHFAASHFSDDWTGEAHVAVLRSRDGGASWRTTRVDTSAEAPRCGWSPGCYQGFFGPTAGLAIDAAGLLMIAYNAGDTDRGAQRLWVRTSADGGVTWSPRQRLSRPAARIHNAFPALAAGPAAGDFRLVWQDDRKSPRGARRGGKRWNTWYRRTTDGGRSWGRAIRLSDLGAETGYKSARGYRFPYGDYLEIETDAAGIDHVLWGEGRSYAGNGGSWFTRGRSAHTGQPRSKTIR